MNTERKGVRSVFHRASLLVGVLVLLLGAAGDVAARKLTVRKTPTSQALRSSEERSAPTAGRFDPEERIRRLPLELGRIPSVFERRRLERRPDLTRAGGPDTLVVKVAAIRIEFAEDRKGSETTGDGRMMRENPDPEGIFIDYAPHDEDYFKAHLVALDRYFSSMTYGRLRVEGDVFPRNEPFGSYELSDMADYGPESEDQFFSIEGLTNYSREALIAADADPDLVWSDYDVYFVMHAGSDWQNDVLRNSPFDLPTFSIGFADSDVVITDSDPPDTLTTMITFPETSSQDGFLVALNGVIAHEFGHQLGLFDIYNVETFASTVGFYDLMDSGNLASVFIPNPTTGEETQVIGVLPTGLGAWSRWLVTFQFGIEPTLVKEDANRLRLRAITSQVGEGVLPPGTSKWYEIPISDTEYFLVENRVDDLDGRTPDGFIDTALDQDDSTGVVLGPIVGSAEDIVISHNYDLLLDPGVLIWHIDERQALANLTRGRGLNVFFEKRSVTIEEADGFIDFGNPFSFFPLGTDKETFHAGNNANFTATTRPNSDSNLGSPSNISITNVSARDTTVTFNLAFSSKPRGWPMEVGRYGTSGGTPPLVADVDGDGTFEIGVVADSSAVVFEYEDGDGDGEVDFAGTWPQPAPDMRLFGDPSHSPVWGDFDGDSMMEFVAVTDSGAVYCWQAAGAPYGAADPNGVILSFAPEDGPSWSPIPADLDADGSDELYLTTLDGRLRGYDLSGGTPSEIFPARPLLGVLADSVDVLTSTLAFGDLNSDGRLDGVVAYAHPDSAYFQRFDAEGRRLPRSGFPLAEGSAGERVWIALADLDEDSGDTNLEVVLVTEGGWVNVASAEGETLPGWPRNVLAPVGGPPAIGDVDGDGLLELVVTSGNRSVYAFNYNGTQLVGWPVKAEVGDHPGFGQPPSGPVIADVNGDGRLDVVAGFVDFTVRAFDRNGDLVEGFPFVTGARVQSTPAVLDANGDGRLDLFVQAADGHVYARVLPGIASQSNPAWSMFGGGPRLHGAFEAGRHPGSVVEDQRFLRGPVQVYPNPVTSSHEEISIRYTLGEAFDSATGVQITLYNVAGEPVETLSGTAFPNTENVVTLPSNMLASGVYLCSVRARTGAQAETHLGKFAVIR